MLWSFWKKGLAKETNLMQVLVVAWIETLYGINNVDIALCSYKIWNLNSKCSMLIGRHTTNIGTVLLLSWGKQKQYTYFFLCLQVANVFEETCFNWIQIH
jgi:hypothetical protein